MAQLDVEPKKNEWWKWLVGILALIIIIWVIVEFLNDDADNDVLEQETVSVLQTNTPLFIPVSEV